MAEIKTKRVIFKENPHIATINEADFKADLHEDIDWNESPSRARSYLEKHGASAEALANPDLPPSPEEKPAVTAGGKVSK